MQPMSRFHPGGLDPELPCYSFLLLLQVLSIRGGLLSTQSRPGDMAGPLASPPSDLWAIHLDQHTEDVEVVLKAKLPQSLWNLSPNDAQEPSNEFLEYYRGQLVGVEAHKLNLKTHQGLMDLINFIKTRADFTKPELIDCLETSWPDLGPSIPAIELALRVWLFLPMEEWGSRQTLEQYIHSKFPRSNSLPDSPPIALNFNALNLEQIGGFSIVWTESLQDHLSLSIDDTEKELRIFHVASFLHGYGKSRDRYESTLSPNSLPSTDHSQAHLPTGIP